MKHWDLPFSVWISELEKELFSAHPVTLEEELILACPFTMNFLQLNKRQEAGGPKVKEKACAPHLRANLDRGSEF